MCIAEQFLTDADREDRRRAPKVDSACFGIAGPIENNICRATNLPWVVDGRALSQRLAIPRVQLVNDFHAAALGVTARRPRRAGRAGRRSARRARTDRGAGRGHRPRARRSCSGRRHENRYQVVPSEGGHVDLPARTPLEHGLVQFLTNKYGRVSCERVLSGKGLVDVFTFLSEEPACRGLIRPRPPPCWRRPGPGSDPGRRDLEARDGRQPIRSARWRWPSSAPCWARSPATWA